MKQDLEASFEASREEVERVSIESYAAINSLREELAGVHSRADALEEIKASMVLELLEKENCLLDSRAKCQSLEAVQQDYSTRVKDIEERYLKIQAELEVPNP